jgi:hypothetical protein
MGYITSIYAFLLAILYNPIQTDWAQVAVFANAGEFKLLELEKHTTFSESNAPPI